MVRCCAHFFPICPLALHCHTLNLNLVFAWTWSQTRGGNTCRKNEESDDSPEHHCFRHSNFWIALYRFRCFSSAGLNPNNHVVSCRQWCELSQLSHRKSARILVDLLVEVLEPELQAGGASGPWGQRQRLPNVTALLRQYGDQVSRVTCYPVRMAAHQKRARAATTPVDFKSDGQ